MEDELSFFELLEEFRNQEKIFCLEGGRGVAGLEKICEAIGYRDQPFRYGSPLESFLSDNSGAIEVLLEWIAEQDTEDWRDSLESHLKSQEDD